MPFIVQPAVARVNDNETPCQRNSFHCFFVSKANGFSPTFSCGTYPPGPLRFDTHGMPDVGPLPGATYDADCLWWQHERLHRGILMDYGNRLPAFAVERDRLERSFIEKADQASGEENPHLCREAFEHAQELTRSWIDRIEAMPVEKPPGWAYRRYWQALNRKARLPAKV